MNQDFDIPATPSVARRLLKLAEINTRVVVDPALASLAEQGLLTDDQLAPYGLSTPQRELVQELFDFDLRGGVLMPERQWVESRDWSAAIAAAAHLYGLKRVLILHERSQMRRKSTMCEEAERVFGKEAVSYISSPLKMLDEDLSKKRKDILLVYIEEGFIASLPMIAHEVFHTVLVGPQRIVNNVSMFNGMTSLSGSIGENSQGMRTDGFSMSSKKIAFLFNIAISMNRQSVEPA